MRSATVVALVLSLSPAALGDTTDRPPPQAPFQATGDLPFTGMRHHQPSQAEIDERDDARSSAGRVQIGAAQSAELGKDRVWHRFLDACMTRLHLDEPLGSERNHRGFCDCQLHALEKSRTPADVDAVAVNIEERNVAKVAISRLPAEVDRSNQAAIEACMTELSR